MTVKEIVSILYGDEWDRYRMLIYREMNKLVKHHYLRRAKKKHGVWQYERTAKAAPDTRFNRESQVRVKKRALSNV